jgi:hypothetical protein
MVFARIELFLRTLAIGGRRTAICCFVALVLLAAGVQSARLGMTGLIAELGQHEVDRWTASSRPRDMREVSRVARYFTDSLDYWPDNPWALERLGALDLARMRLSTVPRQALAYTWAARLRYREALRQRPTSPYLWANLALSKLYLDQVDDELFTALRNADELGPWEPATQQTVLFVGLAAWEKLDSGLRQRIGGVLERGAVRNPAKMLEIVKSFGRTDLICGMKGYHVKGRSPCGNADQTAQPGAHAK